MKNLLLEPRLLVAFTVADHTPAIAATAISWPGRVSGQAHQVLGHYQPPATPLKPILAQRFIRWLALTRNRQCHQLNLDTVPITLTARRLARKRARLRWLLSEGLKDSDNYIPVANALTFASLPALRAFPVKTLEERALLEALPGLLPALRAQAAALSSRAAA